MATNPTPTVRGGGGGVTCGNGQEGWGRQRDEHLPASQRKWLVIRSLFSRTQASVITTIAMVQVPLVVLGHNTFPDQLTFRKYCTLEPPFERPSFSLSPLSLSTARKTNTCLMRHRHLRVLDTLYQVRRPTAVVGVVPSGVLIERLLSVRL